MEKVEKLQIEIARMMNDAGLSHFEKFGILEAIRFTIYIDMQMSVKAGMEQIEKLSPEKQLELLKKLEERRKNELSEL